MTGYDWVLMHRVREVDGDDDDSAQTLLTFFGGAPNPNFELLEIGG